MYRDMRKKKRGFTLTEIAIVLGIIGLILGAIWVAAAAVYNNMRTSKATTELLTVVQNVRALYATSQIVSAASDMTATGAQAGAALTYVQAGIFPTDTLNNVSPTLATQALDPWGGNLSIKSQTAVTAGDSFEVALDKVPQDACVSILSSNVGQGRDPNMVGAGAGAAGAYPSGLAMAASAGAFAATAIVTAPPSTARGQCQGANNQNSVGFAFLLK